MCRLCHHLVQLVLRSAPHLSLVLKSQPLKLAKLFTRWFMPANLSCWYIISWYTRFCFLDHNMLSNGMLRFYIPDWAYELTVCPHKLGNLHISIMIMLYWNWATINLSKQIASFNATPFETLYIILRLMDTPRTSKAFINIYTNDLRFSQDSMYTIFCYLWHQKFPEEFARYWLIVAEGYDKRCLAIKVFIWCKYVCQLRYIYIYIHIHKTFIHMLHQFCFGFLSV